jgi:8-amino-7-oxononanoate synthase/acyl carrier protein
MRIYTQLQGCSTMEQLYALMLENAQEVMAEYFDGRIQTVTFNEFGRITSAMAARIRSEIGEANAGWLGGLRAENSYLYPAMLWGLLMAGYKPLLIDIKATDEQVAGILHDAGAKFIINEVPNTLDAGIKQIPISALNTLQGSTAVFTPAWADEYALCTSGTTGSSKVFVFDGASTCVQMLGAKEMFRGRLLRDGKIKSLAFLPLNHIFGFMGVHMAYNIFGKTVVYLPDRKPSTILEACRRHQVTHILAVPLVWNNVAKGILRKAKLQNDETYKKLMAGIDRSISVQQKLKTLGQKIISKTELKEVQRALLGDSIEYLVSGGGRVLPETLRVLSGVGYSICCGFGMTELGVMSVEIDPRLDIRLSGSIGPAFSQNEYKLKPLPEGHDPNVGELIIKTKSMHKGRMVDGVMLPPEVDENGYFATGDIARMENGHVWIEGRLKEIIIGESGENVYPDEIEQKFDALPNVDQYCVFGLSRRGANEEIAMIVDMGDKRFNQAAVKELVDHFNAINIQLPIYKRVRFLYSSDVPLPLANSIKVKRQTVKRMMDNDGWNCTEIDVMNKRLKLAEGQEDKAEKQAQQQQNAQFTKILGDVKTIFGEVLNLDPESIDENAHFIYDLGGDSLSSLSVYTAIEEKFGIPISENEFMECTTALEAAKLLHAVKTGASMPSRVRGDAARQITRFEDTPEYQELQARMERELKNSRSPYFVEHDSALTDTSVVDGKRVLNFASYNYLCLSGHPDTVKAAKDAADKYGTSASGSRLLTGEKPIHRQLEEAIAEWKHTEAALVLVGGHSTNVTFIGNFCNRNDLIIYDALSHNSVIQGVQLSKSDAKPFPHNDTAALERLLKMYRPKYEKVLIFIEGAYSMDGDVAPVPEVVRLKKEYGCFLMVDEAHSACVLGEHGGGVDEYFGLEPTDIDIKMGTLSKGLGTCGGYLAGSMALITYLKYSVPGFVFSVGLSPVLAAATLEAIKVIAREPERVQALHRNIHDFLEIAHSYGFDTCLAKDTAVVPILIGGDSEAFNLSIELLDRGIFVPPAVFPAVARNQARLRFCVTSNHTRDEIETAIKTLDELCKEHGYVVPRREYA